MKIKLREKKLLLITAGVAVAVLGYQLAVAPLVRWRQSLREQVVQAQDELAQCQTSLRQKAVIDERYRRMAVDLRQKGTNEEVIVALLQDLQKKAAPLSPKGTKVLPIEEGPFYRKFRTAMELEGPMLALADFLRTIATAKEPLRIEQLDIRAAGAEDGAENVHAAIVISAVYTAGN